MVVVQQRSQPAQQRHIWAHGYFEARLEEECARAQREQRDLRRHAHSLPRARREPHRRADARRAAARDGRDRLLRAGASTRCCSSTSRARRSAASSRKLGERARGGTGRASSIGLAMYPTDARNPYELLSRASSSAMGAAAGKAITPLRDRERARSQNLDRIVHRIAAGTISVLVLGETGVGKEVLAERIHRLSPRADKPFLRLQLRRALRDAARERAVRPREGRVHRRGAGASPACSRPPTAAPSSSTRSASCRWRSRSSCCACSRSARCCASARSSRASIDVRFVAATNRDLEAEVARGTFRQDLVLPPQRHRRSSIPPLRERTSEIPSSWPRSSSSPPSAMASQSAGIGREALALLCEYTWPGNIRELRNLIERAVLLAGGGMVDVEHLPIEKMRAATRAIVTHKPPTIPPPFAQEPETRRRPNANPNTKTDSCPRAQAGRYLGTRPHHRCARACRRQSEESRGAARGLAPHADQPTRGVRDPATAQEVTFASVSIFRIAAPLMLLTT